LAACTENAACALWDLDHPAIPPLVIEDVARVLAISEAGMVIESAKRGAKNYHILQQALADDGRTVRSELLTEFDSFLSVSESSNILAVQRPSESIEIWNLNELSQQRSLDLHGSQLLAISPDGRWGLAGQYGYELLDRGAEPIKRVHLGIPDDWIAFAQFSPDSRFLAAVVADPAALSAALSLAQHPHFRLVFLWDLNDVGGSGTLSERAVISSHPSKVESLFLSEKRLVSASAESMQVRSLLSESLKDPELTVPITSSVLSIRILHERWLVAQLHDHSLKVWDLDSPGKPPHHFIGHDGLVNSVNMSADGAWLFSNRVAESSRRWMLPSIPGDSYNLHKSRWPIHGIAMPDAGVAFVGYENSGPAASGIEKFTISRDGLFAEKEAWTAQMLKSLDVSVNGRWMVWVTQYDASICDLMSTDRSAFGIWQPAVGKPDSCTTTFSSDGRWLMVNSETGKSSLWALPREQGLPTRVSPQAGNPIADDPSYRRIAIEPNGQWMVTSDQSKRVICWNLSGDLPHPTDTMLGNIKLPNQLESVSRDHRWVVLKSPGDLAWLCDLSNPDAAAVRLFNIELPVQSIEVSPDQKWVVTASKSGQSLRLSRIQNVISEPVELDAQTRIIDLNRECEVLFSPDSRHLVVWGVDDVLRLWRLTAPRTAVPLELRGHEQIVRHVTFARDNGCLISGSDDGTIRLWDLNEQEIVSVVLRGHTGPVTALAMAPGLDRLVTGGKDGTIRVWDLWQPNAIKTQRLQELIERATLSAGRELSTAEVKQYLRK
jgi:WD40 repeat protein